MPAVGLAVGTLAAMGSDRVARPSARYQGAPGWATDAILGAFYEVYNELGAGFLESVYEAAMAIVLSQMRIDVQRQAQVGVRFRDTVIGSFRIDLLVGSRVAVEVKAAKTLDPAHEAQLLNYLRATDLEVGLLLNFGARPEFKRLVYSNDRKRARQAASDGAAENKRNWPQMNADPTTGGPSSTAGP
jgi:GxxExxY protein